jgi:hypothetical protein
VTGALRQELANYLGLRRAMGYRMARPEKLLGKFLGFLQSRGQTRITVATALDWARLPASAGTTNWWAYRLSAVRGFATYLHALDPMHEVPAADLLPQRTRRASLAEGQRLGLEPSSEHLPSSAVGSRWEVMTNIHDWRFGSNLTAIWPSVLTDHSWRHHRRRPM